MSNLDIRREDTLGIIGGMGPLATAYFYELIINRTKAYKDQDHLNMVILNNASIPDRTSYILGKSEQNPYPQLLKDAKTLELLGVDLIAIPCNTSNYFHEQLQQEVKVPILNMIEDTARKMHDVGIKRVLTLATSGTLESGLYQKACQKYGIVCKVPENQNAIMNIIYQRVKKNLPLTDEDIASLYDGLNEVDATILGCTELSVLKGTLKLGEKFVDPLEVETEIILDFFRKEKTSELLIPSLSVISNTKVEERPKLILTDNKSI